MNVKISRNIAKTEITEDWVFVRNYLKHAKSTVFSRIVPKEKTLFPAILPTSEDT